jgi:hypothetical protein
VGFEVPALVVTVMSTVPVPGGLVTVSCVTESAVMAAAAPPKLTRVAEPRPVPLMVTVVPPEVVPLAGETPVTAGGDEGDDEDEPVARTVPAATSAIAAPTTMAAVRGLTRRSRRFRCRRCQRCRDSRTG